MSCGTDPLEPLASAASAVFHVFDVVDPDSPVSSGGVPSGGGRSLPSEIRACGAYGTEMRTSWDSGSFDFFFCGRLKKRKKRAAAIPPSMNPPMPAATPAAIVGVLLDAGVDVLVTDSVINQDIMGMNVLNR